MTSGLLTQINCRENCAVAVLKGAVFKYRWSRKTGGLLTQVNCREKCAFAVLKEAVSKHRWSEGQVQGGLL